MPQFHSTSSLYCDMLYKLHDPLTSGTWDRELGDCCRPQGYNRKGQWGVYVTLWVSALISVSRVYRCEADRTQRDLAEASSRGV